MVDLDFSKAFTKLDGLKLTKEVTEETLLNLMVTLISVVPPKLFNVAVKKQITLLEYLEWLKGYAQKKLKEHKAKGDKRKVKIDENVLKLLKFIYAVLGFLKVSAKSYSPTKVREFFQPTKLYTKLKEVLPKTKEIDPQGYRNLLYLTKLIENNPKWWVKQVRELRNFFSGE